MLMVDRFSPDPERNRDRLLASIDAIIPMIAAGGEQAEDLRHLPLELSALMRDSGLYLLRTPHVVGGAEADAAIQMEVIEKVAYHSSAAAWCLLNNSNLLGMVTANLPDEALAEVCSGPKLPVAAGGGGMVPGQLEAVEGGFILSGRWGWGSGVHGADWLVVPGRIGVDGEKPARIYTCVFPKASAQLIDTWQVLGLRGTGSWDFSVDRLFIPAGFTYPFRGSAESTGPRRGGATYRLELYSFTSPAYVALLSGIARRAMDEVMALAESKKRRSGAGSISLADRGIFHRCVADADLHMKGLRQLVLHLAKKAVSSIEAGRGSDAAIEAEIAAVGAQMAAVATRFASDALHFAGGSGIWSGHILERCLRDLHVASTHIWVSDMAIEAHGRRLLDAIGERNVDGQ